MDGGTAVTQPYGRGAFDGASDGIGGDGAQEHGGSTVNLSGNSSDARAAAILEGEDGNHRSPTSKKNFQRLHVLKSSSPMSTLKKRFRHRMTRSGSMDGLRGLPGVNGAGNLVLTRVGSHGNNSSEIDVFVSGSEDSGESVEEGGGGGGGGTVATSGVRGDEDGDGKREGGQGLRDTDGKGRGAIKMARGISKNLARRFTRRSTRAAEAMTEGRGVSNSYLRAHDSDFDGDGARSYPGVWRNDSNSPEQSARKLPQDWDLPLVDTGPVTPPSPWPPQPLQGKPPGSSGSRQPSPTKFAGYYNQSRSLAGKGIKTADMDGESPRKACRLEEGQGQEGMCRAASAGLSEQGREVARGRLRAHRESKSLSPKGGRRGSGSRSVEVESRRERSHSASPTRSAGFSRKSPSPTPAGTSGLSGLSDHDHPQGKDGQYHRHGHGHDHSLGGTTSSSQASPGSTNNNAATNMVESEQPRWMAGDCYAVPAAPPSELKYGDRLRLWARPSLPTGHHPRLPGGSDISLDVVEDKRREQDMRGTGDDGAISSPEVMLGAGGGGYVGSLEKVQRVSTKLLRRSDLAVIGLSEGKNSAGFTGCHFKAVDPDNKKQDGDVVRHGDVILLVDDNNNVWNENGHFLPGLLKLKPRGSKREIAVTFKPSVADRKVDSDKLLPPVVFGPQGLQLITVDSGNKRRTSSRKHFHALTAFSKKSTGNSNASAVAGTFLCSDGRREPIVFDVHLPNASPVGDPSPVVTKVTIHVEEKEQPRHHQWDSRLPEQLPDLQKVPSDTTTASLSIATADGSNSGARNGTGVAGITSFRPKALVTTRFKVGRKLKPAYKRRNSQSHKRPGSMSTGIDHSRRRRSERGGGSGSNPYSLSPDGPERSPTPSAFSQDHVDGDDELLLSEEGGSLSDEGLGSFEGLKWGEYVQFKMPDEGQNTSSEKLLTLRLSNGYTATLTRKELQENVGLSQFPVKANKIKGSPTSLELNEDIPSGNGFVYLRCTLTPIVCSKAKEAATAATAAAATTRKLSAEREAAGLAERFLPSALRMLWTKYAGEARASVSGVHVGVVKPSASSGVLATFVRSVALVVFVGAALLSSWTIGSSFLSSPISMSRSSRPLQSTGINTTPTAGEVSFLPPSPCTIWKIRRPDGTAYPHNQINAAAAALDAAADYEEDEAENQDRRRGHPQDEGGDRIDGETGGRMTRLLGETEEAGNGHVSRVSYPGGGRAVAKADAVNAAPLAAPAPQVEGNGVVSRALATNGGVGHGHGHGHGWHGRDYGRVEVGGIGMSAVVGAIGLAAVALVVAVMNGLFGLGNTSPSPEPLPPSPPMQAQVYLLGWDGRRRSEVAAATEDIDILFYPPPSGSSLEPMPHRFLLAESMDVAKAWARWETTLEWRKETDADHILDKPHPKFALIKSKYAHCFHLPDKGGRVTYYERPGMSNIAELKRLGITKAELLEHYVYCMEYLWQVLQPRQSQRITIVIDLEGVKFRDLVGESLAFLKTSVGMMSRHYPQRSFKIMILNAPSFFNSVFALVKPMLNEATKKKIDLLPVANLGEEMLKVIPSEHLPPHYGGTGQEALGESPAELAMLAHVQKVLEDNGQTMLKGS